MSDGLIDPDSERGLYNKFSVARNSPYSGRKHVRCEYFVLDLDHDAYAAPALLAYASACDAAYPLLACDLRAKVVSRCVRACTSCGGNRCDYPDTERDCPRCDGKGTEPRAGAGKEGAK